MIAAVRAELLKQGKRPTMGMLALLALGSVVVFRYGVPYTSYLSGVMGVQVLQGLQPMAVVPKLGAAVALELSVVAVLAGALAAGDEHEWGTVKTELTQRASRWRVFGGQVLGFAVMAAILVVTLLAAALASASVIALIEGTPHTRPPVSELGTGVTAWWLIIMMWVACGLLLGTLLRLSGLAAGLGLVWMLGIENTIRELRAQIDFLATVYEALPGANATGLAASLGPVPGSSPPWAGPPPSGSHLTAVVIIYLVAFLVIAGMVFRTRDVK